MKKRNRVSTCEKTHIEIWMLIFSYLYQGKKFWNARRTCKKICEAINKLIEKIHFKIITTEDSKNLLPILFSINIHTNDTYKYNHYSSIDNIEDNSPILLDRSYILMNRKDINYSQFSNLNKIILTTRFFDSSSVVIPRFLPNYVKILSIKYKDSNCPIFTLLLTTKCEILHIDSCSINDIIKIANTTQSKLLRIKNILPQNMNIIDFNDTIEKLLMFYKYNISIDFFMKFHGVQEIFIYKTKHFTEKFIYVPCLFSLKKLKIIYLDVNFLNCTIIYCDYNPLKFDADVKNYSRNLLLHSYILDIKKEYVINSKSRKSKIVIKFLRF